MKCDKKSNRKRILSLRTNFKRFEVKAEAEGPDASGWLLFGRKKWQKGRGKSYCGWLSFYKKPNRKDYRFHLAGMGIEVSDKTTGQRWERRHAFLPRIPFGFRFTPYGVINSLTPSGSFYRPRVQII